MMRINRAHHYPAGGSLPLIVVLFEMIDKLILGDT